MNNKSERSGDGSDSDLSGLANRLAEAVKRAGGRRAVAERAQVPLSSLDRYMRGRSEPPALTLAHLAAACGTSLDAITSGSKPTEVGGPGRSSPEMIGYVSIPQLSVRASAGPGRVVLASDEENRSALALRESWLRFLGVLPSQAELITAEGDSMADTIKDGDLLLVDRGVSRVKGEGIYVLVNAGLVQVKRVQILFDGSWRIISDNPRYPPVLVPADDVNGLQVAGRVRWFGRAI